ncbi:hypothetical protein RZS08_36075, partial [Arthrospira platensis SPKY1]|nr:hypothetical protein [Arthrospira platensis SPKY1]
STAREQLEARRYPALKRGHVLASGHLYLPGALTAGYDSGTLGQFLRLRNPENGLEVTVLLNDRVRGKGLWLSDAAADALGLPDRITPVELLSTPR